MATFTQPANSLTTTLIPAGMWTMNMHALSNDAGAAVKYYFTVYYVNSDGTGQTLIAAGSSATATPVTSTQNIYTYDLYIPATVLADTTKRIQVVVYGVFTGNNKTLTMEMRNGSLSHVHTTLAVSGETGPTGPAGATGPAASDANAWSTYSPAWTAVSSNPSIGDGTLIGRYKQIGKTTFVYIRMQAGSSTTFGSGNWRFSLPVDAQASYSAILPTTFLDNSTAWYQGLSYTEYDGDASYVVPVWDKGATGSSAVNATTPYTWTTTDSLAISGSYESV
jgi:hypothetical protein